MLLQLQSANSAMKRRSLAEKTRKTRNPEELVERLRE